MGRASRYAPEVRERAVRMVAEHQGEYASQWAAMASIAAKIGCTPETLRKWVRQTEHGPTSLKELEHRELKRANGDAAQGSAFFAQAELGRPR